MASRRLAARAFVQCKSQSELTSHKVLNLSPSGRRGLRFTSGPGISSRGYRASFGSLRWTAAFFAVASPFLYMMVRFEGKHDRLSAEPG